MSALVFVSWPHVNLYNILFIRLKQLKCISRGEFHYLLLPVMSDDLTDRRMTEWPPVAFLFICVTYVFSDMFMSFRMSSITCDLYFLDFDLKKSIMCFTCVLNIFFICEMVIKLFICDKFVGSVTTSLMLYFRSWRSVFQMSLTALFCYMCGGNFWYDFLESTTHFRYLCVMEACCIRIKRLLLIYSRLLTNTGKLLQNLTKRPIPTAK